MKPMLPGQPFEFACNAAVSCFNQCCRDLNQFLTPYDIIRLKRRLDMDSSDFLAEYTLRHQGPQSGFPIVTLKMDPADDLKCPFVTPSGCVVYEDRPASCRTYPLIRLAARSRQTGEISETYYLLPETHCLGFNSNRAQTVEKWVKTQEIEPYNRMNDGMLELISIKNRLGSDPFDEGDLESIYTALYDLDEFRRRIQTGEISVAVEDVSELSDVELLKVAMQWIRELMEGHE